MGNDRAKASIPKQVKAKKIRMCIRGIDFCRGMGLGFRVQSSGDIALLCKLFGRVSLRSASIFIKLHDVAPICHPVPTGEAKTTYRRMMVTVVVLA